MEHYYGVQAYETVKSQYVSGLSCGARKDCSGLPASSSASPDQTYVIIFRAEIGN